MSHCPTLPRILLGLVSLLLLAGELSARAKHIDARNASEPAGSAYYQVFSANPGAVGHAFVAWARGDNERLVSESNAFGLYPQNRKTAAFGTVPGEIVAEVSK